MPRSNWRTKFLQKNLDLPEEEKRNINYLHSDKYWSSFSIASSLDNLNLAHSWSSRVPNGASRATLRTSCKPPSPLQYSHNLPSTVYVSINEFLLGLLTIYGINRLPNKQCLLMLFQEWATLKCYYDPIPDIDFFFTFSYTIGLS